MNYETRMADSGDFREVEVEDPDRAPNRRRLIIGALLALAVIAAAALAFSLFGGGGEDAAAGKQGAGAGQGEAAAPSVTVIVPGRQTIDRAISSTGTLAARREMPVGIAGEGGAISRVLVEAGDWVQAGQVLATIERSVQVQQDNQLAAQINVAQADLDLAQANLERAQQLVARGFISKADIDRLTATHDAAAARVRVAQASLAENRARIGRLDIRAPAAGLVLERMAEPGQVVGAGSGVLFRLARGGEMELRAQVSEGDLARITPGVRATVTPVGTNQQFAGEVWQVSPVINPDSRQGIARIALSYDRALRPGGFASATIVSGTTQAPQLPESAVLSDAEGNYVMVVGPDNKVARRAVKVGAVTDRGVSIIEGLNGNEQVVYSAGAFLNPGETVKPVRQAARR